MPLLKIHHLYLPKQTQSYWCLTPLQSYTANADAISAFSSELSKVIRIYIHSWKSLCMHGETSVCQALSVGGLINETDHTVSVCLKRVFSKAAQFDFDSNFADFHHFSRVPQFCWKSNIAWAKPRLVKHLFFSPRKVIKCSLSGEYRAPPLCEMFLSVLDWLVIPPTHFPPFCPPTFPLLSPPYCLLSLRLAWL